MNVEQAKAATRVVWQGMMKGDVAAWVTFFRLIEVGSAVQVIRENSVTYVRRSTSR